MQRARTFINMLSTISIGQRMTNQFLSHSSLSTLGLQSCCLSGLSKHLWKTVGHRYFSLSNSKCQELSAVPGDPMVTDLKPDAQDIFRTAIRSVYPKSMIGNVLNYNSVTSVLKVQGKTYKLNKNVFVVGMGKAVPGMARIVEDILGSHIVAGVISIPDGIQEQIQEENARFVFTYTIIDCLSFF